MLQAAIFVDAGYAYAQGAVTIGSPGVKRHRLRLNPSAIVTALTDLAMSVEPRGRLLRVYWYDGLARGGSMNSDQEALARHQNVKCRFGSINTFGEQKGVDSLIVTDLIELARSHAISDAIILSGDEDVRVGVQVAQGFGIRVHLLGLHPARGSQSPSLIAESDTHHEWGKTQVGQFLTILPEPSGQPSGIPQSTGKLPIASTEEIWMDAFAAERVRAISKNEATEILKFADENQNQLPGDFDRPALGEARVYLGRDLSFNERKDLRAALRAALQALSQT